jgi:hypothetical protein
LVNLLIMSYKEKEKQRQLQLLIEDSSLFNNAKRGALYRNIPRDFFLADIDAKNNLYNSIINDALKYFHDNKISWWGGTTVTGHLLSSQVACLNHLFAIRKDENTVLSVANCITGESFAKVFPVDCDEDSQYIAFEVVSKADHLNESKEKKTLTRGSNCTSIDALILAERPNGKRCMIPIEWKYTEDYGNTNKAQEDGKGSHAKGKNRLHSYSKLMTESVYLKSLSEMGCESYAISEFFVEPYYQLMRQTLWAEQMIKNSYAEDIKADDFIHLIVIPSGNISLRNKISKWQIMLKKGRFLIVDPKSIVDVIEKIDKYFELAGYLKKRYNYCDIA